MPATALPALTLCALRAGVPLDSVAAPSRLLCLPKGSHDAGARGRIICSELTLSGLIAAQSAAKIGPRVALDFNHNTVEGTAAYLAEKEPRAIAAWGTLTPTAAGVELTALEWTPAGLDAWQNKLFQDISPAVFRRTDGTVVAFHSVGLVRHGEIDGLTIEAASAPAALSAAFTGLATLSAETTTTPNMKPTPALIALLSALGVTLSETADETAVEAALLDAAKAVDAMKKAPDAMSAQVGKDGLTLDALAAKIATMETAEADRQKAHLMAAAAAEGKVVPLSAEALKLTPLGVLENIITSLPAGQVPVTKETPAGHQNGTKPDAFSAESLERLAKFGLTADDVKKHGPASLRA